MGRALVTGASAGIGKEIVWLLAEAGHDVVLVSRDAVRLEAMASQLRAAAGIEVDVLPADLSVPEDLERVAARLRSTSRPVGLLVNNAGYGLGGRFVTGDVDHEVRALDVMVKAVLVLSHAAVGAMIPRGRGAVLTVASVAGLMTSGTYSAHKAWARTFGESLARELDGTGVTSTVVNPGLTRTEFHARSGVGHPSAPPWVWLSAERVARDALLAVRRGQVEVTPSLRYRALSTVLRLIPRAGLRGISTRYRRRSR